MSQKLANHLYLLITMQKQFSMKTVIQLRQIVKILVLQRLGLVRTVLVRATNSRYQTCKVCADDVMVYVVTEHMQYYGTEGCQLRKIYGIAG
jgi:hypothetical protein